MFVHTVKCVCIYIYMYMYMYMYVYVFTCIAQVVPLSKLVN